jgi:hypothetical protein
MTSTVPTGRGLSASLSRHFVPGYDQPVPPGQKPFAYLGPRIELALMGFQPQESPPRRRALKGRLQFGHLQKFRSGNLRPEGGCPYAPSASGLPLPLPGEKSPDVNFGSFIAPE